MKEKWAKIIGSRYISYALLALSVAFIFVGTYYEDEHLIVFKKAVKICMECIGIG